MKKKSFPRVLLIVVLVLAVLAGISYAVWSLKDIIPGFLSSVTGMGKTHVFHRISTDYAQGKLTEDDVSQAYFYAAFWPGDPGNPYNGALPEDRSLDMRAHLQNLVNRYGSLDKPLQDRLREVLFPERFPPSVQGDTGFSLIRRAKAEEELYPPMEYVITEGIVVLTHDFDFMTTHGGEVERIALDAMETFDLLGFDKPHFRIEIIPVSLDECFSSYSALIPQYNEDLTVVTIFRIYMDFNRSIMETEASLVHELFHAYQEELLFIPPFPTVTGARIDWLREATALWAVDQVYPGNDYELGYTGGIYRMPFVEYYSLGHGRDYTWYQLFFYITEVLESREPSYVRDLFNSHRLHGNLDAVFQDVHGGRMFFNMDFARLGMALFGGIPENQTFEAHEPFYPSARVSIKNQDIMPLKDILDDAQADWRTESFDTPGFRYMLIKIPRDHQGMLFFQQNLSMERDAQMTGMRIAVKRNGEWQWENIQLEPATHVVDISGSLDVIDEILLMFFCTGFETAEKVEYRITSGSSSKARGTITFRWTKESPSTGGDSEKTQFTAIISESLVKASAGTGDQTVQYLASGERYQIKEMEINYFYRHFLRKGDTEETTQGAGIYRYEDPEAGSAGESPDGLVEVPGLSQLKDYIDKVLIPSIKQMEDMMGQIGDGQGLEGGIPELPELDVPGSPGTGGLSRIIIRPDTGVFEFSPVLPPEALSEEWVDYEYTHTYPDPARPDMKKTERQSYKDRPTDLFPLWFKNPDFSEDASMEDFTFDPDDTMALMQSLTNAQSRLNILNLQRLIDNPQTPYQIDFSDSIEPRPVSAVLIEQAMYNYKTFTASLKASVLTEKGNVITIDIIVEYDFN
ncbi:MAG: hypothetical protein R6W96_03410 [Clostridia bacterium]